MAFELSLLRNTQMHYGVRATNEKFGSQVPSMSRLKTAVWTFPYSDLPVSDANNKIFQRNPSGTYVTRATFQVITAFAGGTSYDIDLVETDASAIGTGEDKLWDALALASIDATEAILELNAFNATSGSNSGDAIMAVTDAVGQLQVVETGTFTAGRATIQLDYLTVPPA